ncbi:MAG: NUDIX hydrolase N-terminal domain-containing protein [Bacilli bacterium]|nr:NUDIX hydrolase N-terminal domain-containing protein [Bacilli bacterium]
MDTKQLYDYILKIQSIAKIGLVFSKDPYAITNYQQINDLTLEMLEKLLDMEFDRPNYFSRDIYPTPSVSVRAVILNEKRDQVLMVRESNSGTYSFPGGWADLYDSAGQTAINESSQEAGADIELVRLVGVLNRIPFKTSVHIPEYLVVFEAKLKGKLHEHEYETDDVQWFSLDHLPPISRKVALEEIDRIITAIKTGETIFD